MNTFGAHHDFVLRDWLEQNGLTPKEISEVEFIMLPPITSEQALRNGQIDVAVLTSITEERALKMVVCVRFLPMSICMVNLLQAATPCVKNSLSDILKWQKLC